MMFSRIVLALLGPSLLLSSVCALHAPLSGRPTPKLARRASMLGTTMLDNSKDLSYFLNITLGGAQYTVQIDTGSADLWVSGEKLPTDNVKNTGKKTSVHYAIGQAEGPILLADLEFAGHRVEQQAFFFATENKSNPLPAPGIMGLGPFTVSQIANTLSTNISSLQGLPPVDSIFLQNKTTPNYLTVLLGRADDPDNKFPGDLTIGEILPGYEDIQKQPKLLADHAQFGNQHWSTLLDEDGIIGPSGKAISAKTNVSSTKNKAQLTAMFDTGYSLPQVPPAIANGIYSQIEGAKLRNVSGLGAVWTLSCDKEVNVTFKIGGEKYLIHPLDTTIEASDLGLEIDICIGAFQPIAPTAANPDIDMILGMAWLRNVYLLVDYGSYVLSKNTKADPFLQLLSTSKNASELHSDFVKVRLSGKDTTDGQRMSNALTSARNRKGKAKGKIARGAIIGLIVAGVVLLLLVGFCCFFILRRRNSRRSSEPYQSLNAPAPAAAIDVHAPYHAQPVSTNYNPYIPPATASYDTYDPGHPQH